MHPFSAPGTVVGALYYQGTVQNGLNFFGLFLNTVSALRCAEEHENESSPSENSRVGYVSFFLKHFRDEPHGRSQIHRLPSDWCVSQGE